MADKAPMPAGDPGWIGSPLVNGKPRRRRWHPKGPKYNRAIADRLCYMVGVEGIPLKTACQQLRGEDPRRAPAESTVRWWIQQDIDGLADRYRRAHRSLVSQWADEIIVIADDRSHDTFVDEHGKERTDHEHINRSRLRVDARKWVLSHILPEQYGDNLDLKVSGDRPPVLVIGLQQPRHDPLALPAPAPDDTTVETDGQGEGALDVTRLVEPWRWSGPTNGQGHDQR